MEHLMACRVCLATDVKLYEMCKYRLKTAYENLTGSNFFMQLCSHQEQYGAQPPLKYYQNDFGITIPPKTVMSCSERLQHVCGYCGAMLNNFTAFREKCGRSQQLLEMLMKEHVLITTCHIKTIERHSHNLTLPFTIQHIQNCDTTTTQNFIPTNASQKFVATVTTQNVDAAITTQKDTTGTTQTFDTIATQDDTTKTKKTFDTTITTHNFSAITVKDEKVDIKSDNNDGYDYNYDCIKNNFDYNNDEIVESYNYCDVENKQYESDEEPLSRKIKKKRKKTKIKLHKRSSVKLRNYDKVDIKTSIIETEDGLNFTSNDQYLATNQSFPTNSQNFATNNHNFATYNQNMLTNNRNMLTNDQNVLKNDQNLPTSNQDFPTNDQDFPTTDQNFLTNDQDFPTNDQDFPTNDHDFPHQVLDLETDHKLVILSKQEQIDEVLLRKTSANYLNSVYKCERCFKGFMTETTYTNHKTRHDPCCGPVACPVCATRWPNARALRAHTLVSHERRYICKVCGHISKSSHKAKEHSQWHAGVTFPCGACSRTFSRSTSLLTHVRLRHATHECGTCGHSFIGENGLSMHRKKAHRDEKADASVHECDNCLVQFRSTAALNRHCDLNGGGCDDTLHVCVHCGDHFASDQLLKEHTDIHLKTDALRTCSQCSRSFANERSLAAHIQRTHARTLTHSPRHCVCEVCGYKCMSASSLVNHQRVHSGEKPHACTHCHKRFSVAQRLQIHVRTHTGERPFQCARCPKAFKHKAALNRHDRVHTGVKPYSCPQCGKRFSQSNSMKQHCAGVHMKTYIYSRRSKQ